MQIFLRSIHLHCYREPPKADVTDPAGLVD